MRGGAPRHKVVDEDALGTAAGRTEVVLDAQCRLQPVGKRNRTPRLRASGWSTSIIPSTPTNNRAAFSSRLCMASCMWRRPSTAIVRTWLTHCRSEFSLLLPPT
jgi:hypothetical protein